MKTQIDLFIAFFRSGMLGFGGGPSAIPLVKKEVVDTFGWMNEDEFADVLALGNTLPGPINTKMAGYIGYRVAGLIGLIIAVSASIVPTIFLMILLLTSLSVYKDQPWVAGITQGVIPIVSVMLFVLAWDFLKNAKKSLGWPISLILLFVSLIVIEILGVHPAIIIALLLLFALLKKNNKQVGSSNKKEVQG
ncbi:chromate transporter [Alkalihalobacterium alkalinitrilicum]|uniref:chromate transporter n=1 Tax=Alkalihalobacterium alkalinitrilicum TaxID=427920 RepID=UPI000995350A|nr:chromate transporter [Alkalihalobacterium alkalinitrilicum]